MLVDVHWNFHDSLHVIIGLNVQNVGHHLIHYGHMKQFQIIQDGMVEQEYPRKQ
jgi:hypothetical protein